MSSNRVSTGSSRRMLHRHDSSFGLQVASASNTKSTKIVRDTKKAKQTKEAPRAMATKDNKPVNLSVEKMAVKLKNQESSEKNKTKRQRNLHDFDQEAEDQFDVMLKGKLGDIPIVPRSIVRIFLSSTFSDMRAERNALVQIVNPKLKEFCSMYDLDFQMVDMRWGVTDDSQNDHTVEKICLQEVENCQKISLGPNFVVIAGNRYGFRPIPTEMSVEEFDLLLKYTADVKDIKLLNTWYLRDDNAQPPQYVLQPIKSQFTFFGDYSPGCDEPREKDKQNWNKTFNEIQAILRRAASSAFQDGKLPKEQLHQYHLSVTEIEITKGMLQVENPQSHTLAYHRDIFGLLDQALKQNGASRYIDVCDNNGKVTIDEDTKQLRERLLKKMQTKIGKNQWKQYSLPWREGGVNPSQHQEHNKYIENFCIDFLSNVTQQIEVALQNYMPKIRFSGYYTDYHELIHHLQFCKTKCETFCGQTEVLDKVKDYILHETRKPLVLHAPSGGGKTSLMAMIMENLSSWLAKKTYVSVIRFLGTSPLSINIYDVLYSVCGQLADNADIIMEPVSYKSMKKLVEYIPRFLRRVSNQLKFPIVIILDSLDQLSPINDAFSLQWLPTQLPANVKLILSTLPEEHGILDNLKVLLPSPECYVEVPLLPTATGREITATYLKKKGRMVTEKQIQILLKTFEKSPQPLFLKLLLDQAVKWNSYTPEHESVLADSVKQAISELFASLETKFGQIVTSRALGYITVGLNGVSEIEIEDALSCDDDALNDVYRYHNPPVEGVIRIPPVLWARIHYDLKEYLVERRAFDKYTLHWYHRQFIETARARYATGRDCEKLHQTMADVFMAENGIKRSIELKWRKITIENGDRQVTLQPVTSGNKRKLASLPHHIIHAGGMISPDTAKEKCFCNFNFIRAKLSSFHVRLLLDDMNSYIEYTEDQEVQKLRNFFSVSNIDVTNDIKLAVSFLVRISPDKDHFHLKQLLNEARTFLISQTSPILVPKYPCLASRRDTSTALSKTVNGCQKILCESNETMLMEMVEDQTDDSTTMHALYNTENGELIYVSIPELASTSLKLNLDKSGKKVIIVEKGSVKILNTSNMKTSTTSLATVTSEPGKAQVKPVKAAMSWDSSELAILFDDSDLLMVDLNSMKKVDMVTLTVDANDVKHILCGSAEKRVVVMSGSTESAENENTLGFVRVWFTGKSNESCFKFKELQNAFSHELICIGASEEVIVGVSNTEDQAFFLCMDMDSLEDVCEMNFSHPVHQLVVSKSRYEAVLVTADGIASIVDCKEGIVRHKLPINNSVTCINVSWTNDLAFLGDDQGQITLYSIKNRIHRGAFPAHQKPVEEISILDDHIASMGRNREMKVWSLSALEDDIKESRQNDGDDDKSDLLSMKDATCFDISLDSQELFVASQDHSVYVWSLNDLNFVRRYDIGIVVNKMKVVQDNLCIAIERKTGTLKVFDVISGKKALSDVPRNVVDFAVSQDMSSLCTVSEKEKGLLVDLYDLVVKKSKKSFYLKQSLVYESLDITLNANARFLLLRTKQTPDQLKEIELSWKKQGSFLPQYHPYRFTAVDLTQANGGLMSCLRMMSKIPHLGEVICPLQGNIMLLTTRRWVLFWDIPTGKCDQKVTKTEKKGMMYRPDWLGQDCKGTSHALVRTNDGQYVGVGSEDGYVFIYQADTGIPVSKRAPATKHSAPVTTLEASPDSRWMVSACRNNTIKVWNTGTGKETFSTRVNAEVTCIKFSQDSQTLVVTTGTYVTRILVYQLHTGQ